MYALANIDFSDWLGFVVSELTPDEIDCQDPGGRAGCLLARWRARGGGFRSCLGWQGPVFLVGEIEEAQHG